MKTGFIPCHPQTFGNVNDKYKAFKQAIIEKINGRLEGELRITLEIHIERMRAEGSDLDNYIKAPIDALHEGNAFDNESQISNIIVKRFVVDAPDKEGINIEIEKLR